MSRSASPPPSCRSCPTSRWHGAWRNTGTPPPPSATAGRGSATAWETLSEQPWGPMRVALYDNLGSGGSKREAYELSRALTEHGHEVDLWTTSAADRTFLPMERVTRQRFEADWPRARPLP